MTTLPKKAMLLIGGALLLPFLVLVVARPPQVNTTPDWATRSSDGWTCDWLGEPTIIHGAVRKQCRGVVQCRHRTMQTFIPQIRNVTCLFQDHACDPAACSPAQSARLGGPTRTSQREPTPLPTATSRLKVAGRL